MSPSERARRAPVAASLLLCLLGGVAPVPAAHGGQTAAAQAQGATNARAYMTEVLDHVSGYLLADVPDAKKRDQVQEVINTSVDFNTVSKLVLAQNWSKFSDEQKKTFVELFRRHLLYTYWRNASYSQFAGITVVGDRKEMGRDWTVKTTVQLKGSDDIKIDYRLRQAGKEGDVGGDWKVIDILVEGVSLISNFRSQFQSIVAGEGADKLLQLLRDKVAEAEKAEAK